MKAILFSLCLVALLCYSVQAYINPQVQQQATTILSKVNYDSSKLTPQERETLLNMGFSHGDLDDHGAITDEDFSPRFKELKSKTHQQQQQLQQQEETETASVHALPDPSLSGFTDTGNRFFVKAFIPGPGCSSSHLSFIPVNPKCEAPKKTVGSDGTSDDLVLASPGLGINPDWFRGDSRCTSASVSASYRIGALCKIFKRESDGKFRVKCGSNAGWTHHWKREGFTSSGCWYMSCDELDSFNGNYESEVFERTTTFRMNMAASNPCVTGAPRIVMDFTVEISISGGQTALKLTGNKSRFPAMEGYYKGKDESAYNEWFYWNIGDRTVLSLMLPNVNIDWDTRMFPCHGC